MAESPLYDVGVVGGGIAGIATAARLQAQGLSTVVFEAHGQPGGCAGFFRRSGFAFDVGAPLWSILEPGALAENYFRALVWRRSQARRCPVIVHGFPTVLFPFTATLGFGELN